jgi:DNA phosphorothioation-associated DGQHR protein 1
MGEKPFFEASVLRVEQPLGTFFVAVIPANILLKVAGSDQLRATRTADADGYTLSGTQRERQEKRYQEIARYIERVDASFPNSIILAANYNTETGLDQEEVEAIASEETVGVSAEKPSKAWHVVETLGGLKLVLPTGDMIASIIDGQHRLLAFQRAEPRMSTMELVCSIFLDIPKPLQAQLFATINSTQKPVDRSLTYELFGYNVSDEPEVLWTPDKLSVFLTRRLGTDANSSLLGKITVAPKRDVALEDLTKGTAWRVSTAVVVDGILRLISSNPKRDANLMRSKTAQPRSALIGGAKDKSPMRDVFVEGNDSLIYTMVANYLEACEAVFWKKASADSFITKTVGVQALFDVLRRLAEATLENKDLRVAHFEALLKPAADIDFAGEGFRNASGSGRSAIRRAIEEAMA